MPEEEIKTTETPEEEEEVKTEEETPAPAETVASPEATETARVGQL